MKEILIVTSNLNKIKEFKEMLLPLGYDVKSLKDYGDDTDIFEDGNSFMENAIIKAKYGSSKYNVAAIADDSGLVVNALNGEPGIYSARYLGKDTSYKDKNENIICRLKDKEDRSASFHCAIALVIPNQDPKCFEGIMEGYISDELKGTNGFGYDPIFIVPSFNKTSAELTSEEKNSVSHRGKALKMLMNYLSENDIDINIGDKK